jgi:predicted Zn finger-like uncharacterized protein
MFTICPKCSLKLSVTAADLRVAQGFVRCGRCSSVFNALAGLTDEQQSALAAEELRPTEHASKHASSAGASAAVAPNTREEPAVPKAAADEPISDSALEFDHTSTDVSQVFVEPSAAASGATGTFEAIVLESEDASAEDEPQDPEDIGFELEDIGTPPETTSTPTRTTTPPDSTAARESAERRGTPEQARVAALSEPKPSRTESATPSRDAHSAADDALTSDVDDATGAATPQATTPAPVRTTRISASLPFPPHDPLGAEPVDRADRLLQVGCVVAILILIAQIVHHYRVELADYPSLRGPLTSLYAALRVPLPPHWDVSAYEVHQLGAFAGPQSPGELTVRASVKNTAARVQPLPLLRIIVQDRFGNRIAARDVPPDAYLSHAGSRGFLGAGQRIDAEVAFVDPGPNAVGFEVDACLEQTPGRIRCANDPNAAH